MKQFLHSIRQKLLFALSANNNPLFVGFYKYIYRPKRGTLAFQLDRLSKKNQDFFVLQVGANDGITHDPIHKFIKRDRWMGILLEPQKDVFQKLLQPLYENQPGIITLNAALGHREGEAIMYRIGFSNKRWATGLTSFNKSVLEGAFSSGHVARQARKEGIKVPSTADKRIAEERVPVVTVAKLIAEYQIRKIDLLQIDTEGFDFEVIRLFDFGTIRPQAISYENSHLSDEDRAACQQLLEDSGFQLFHYGGNSLALFEK